MATLEEKLEMADPEPVDVGPEHEECVGCERYDVLNWLAECPSCEQERKQRVMEGRVDDWRAAPRHFPPFHTRLT